ncbi:hypothetical protein BT69DRAFT_229226 [Atractiella rhizophila]|nr:hypothetical protein BT69DRAFT_229226 [Atractiella rhizophila]
MSRCTACEWHNVLECEPVAPPARTPCKRCRKIGLSCTFSSTKRAGLRLGRRNPGNREVPLQGRHKSIRIGDSGGKGQQLTEQRDAVAYSMLRAMNISASSLNSRLGEIQLMISLGNHLLSVASIHLRADFSFLSFLPFSEDWVSYERLRSNQTSLGPYLDLWIAYCLAMASSISNHSAIVGHKNAMESIPLQTLNSTELNDLRQAGYSRYAIQAHFVDKCYNVAISVLSSFGQTDFQAFKIAVTILGTVNKNDEQVRPRKRLLIEECARCFRNLWEQAENDTKKAGDVTNLRHAMC